jgi:repressor LexA
MIEDEATVKRLNLKNGIWLMPENDAYEPIDGTHCTVLGVVVSLYRDNVI